MPAARTGLTPGTATVAPGARWTARRGASGSRRTGKDGLDVVVAIEPDPIELDPIKPLTMGGGYESQLCPSSKSKT